MIKAKNLVKSYGSGELLQTVLKGIDISIDSGEFVAIIGPSGAGKSTLMYQLSLLDEPTSGKIEIDEQDVVTISAMEKTKLRLNNLGYVFQDYALLPELTAEENVLLPLIMQGKDFNLAKQSADLVLEKIGLKDKKHSLPSQLSGGQQQRVSIARAMSHNPKILFADEPTANLDSTSSEQVISLFEELNANGQTIVMVTHENEYAQRAGRIVTLVDGLISSDIKKQ